MTGAAAGDAPATPSAPMAPEQPLVAPRRRPVWPGVLAAVLALLAVAGLVTGIVLATSDLHEPATWVAWAAIGISAAAVLLGLVAAIAGLGRAWGVTGAVVGLVSNPLVLVHGLDLIGRLGA